MTDLGNMIDRDDEALRKLAAAEAELEVERVRRIAAESNHKALLKANERQEDLIESLRARLAAAEANVKKLNERLLQIHTAAGEAIVGAPSPIDAFRMLKEQLDELRKKLVALCDHDWEIVDDSFDHAYGCEKIIYKRCLNCDAVEPYEPESFID